MALLDADAKNPSGWDVKAFEVDWLDHAPVQKLALFESKGFEHDSRGEVRRLRAPW